MPAYPHSVRIYMLIEVIVLCFGSLFLCNIDSAKYDCTDFDT